MRVVLVNRSPSRPAAPSGTVAYASGGLAEYVGDARGGVVVPPNPRELARASGELHAERDHWEGLSVTGRRWVEGAHSPERYAERLESLYARASTKAFAGGAG